MVPGGGFPDTDLGRVLTIMATVASDARGLSFEWSNIFLSFTIFIASFLAHRSSIFLQPWAIGFES